ncbi:MAG: acyl-CoA thioesterase [Polyangiaceae bacterium]|nr:acyl-CoA thioesterase [Polyangiaceae bacterium]
MSSAEFDPPANAFSHPFVVPATAIDDLGHASNVAWVRWVQDAATTHSRTVGLDLDEYRRLGVLWVVRRHEIEYLAPAFDGESLSALTWIASMRAATSLRRTVFRRATDGALLCQAATTWVLIDIQSGRPTRVPKDLLARYGFGTLS